MTASGDHRAAGDARCWVSILDPNKLPMIPTYHFKSHRPHNLAGCRRRNEHGFGARERALCLFIYLHLGANGAGVPRVHPLPHPRHASVHYCKRRASVSNES